MSHTTLFRYCLATLCAALVAGCATVETTQSSGGGTGTAQAQLSPEVAQQLKAEEERARAEADAEAQARAQALLDPATEAFVKGGIAERSGQPEEALSQFMIAFQTHGKAFDAASADDQRVTIGRQIVEDQKKVIAVALQFPTPPSAPEEARKEVAFGMAALKEAQTDSDLREAASHFERALGLAPWLAGAYYNLALVQERLHKYEDAVANLQFYLLAAPRANDAQAVQDKIYELEFAVKRRAQRQEWLGRWELSGPVKHSLSAYREIHNGPIYLWVLVDEIGRDGHAHGKILYDEDKFKGSTAPEAKEAQWVFYPYPFSIESESYYGAGAAEWRGTWTASQLVLEWTPQRPKLDADVDVTMNGHGRLEITKQDGRYHAALSCSCKLRTSYRSASSTAEIEDSYSGEAVRTATLKHPPED